MNMQEEEEQQQQRQMRPRVGEFTSRAQYRLDCAELTAPAGQLGRAGERKRRTPKVCDTLHVGDR